LSVYRQEMARTGELVEKRQVFAKLLATLVDANKPLIYVDETTFNTWQMKAKSWSKRDQPLYHARNSKRITVTVYGAIGHCLQRPVFRLGCSTNAEEYKRFLTEVHENLKPEVTFNRAKPILLYDGATAHTSNASKAFMGKYFEPLQIPIYSCEFNCKSNRFFKL
jgi:hypothetical protein